MNSKKMNNTSMIRWMRNKVKPDIISSSLTSLLLEKEKKRPMFLRIIDNNQILNTLNHGETFNRRSHLKIKPKMFFNNTILNKIYQIRDIFLDFDDDRSKTLEISELHTMFNSNNIPVTEKELVELFGKGKKKKISDYKLTFLDIVMFSLSEEHNINFRNLMKKLKERVGKEVFIPLDFNAALEYIYNRGKIKKGFKKINKGIKTLDRLFNQNYNDQIDNKPVTNYILSKLGIGPNINTSQVCKGFSDIIEISRNSINKIIPKYLVQKKESPLIAQLRKQMNDKSLSSAIREQPARNSRNKKQTLPDEKSACLNNNLPTVNKGKYPLKTTKKMYEKYNIKYVSPSLSSSNNNNITSAFSTQCRTERN